MFDAPVLDFDLVSAYATVLSNLPEWDFDLPKKFRRVAKLYEHLLENPFATGWVDIWFRFRPGTRYPSLPDRHDDALVFPMSGAIRATLQE